ncbi:MAG: DUF465 domain-containing protein [Gammaproteobacteria bacterium]
MEKKKLSLVKTQLVELEHEHRDLDNAIKEFSEDRGTDLVKLKRLKKRKLALKDQIAQLKSKLIPDMDA